MKKVTYVFAALSLLFIGCSKNGQEPGGVSFNASNLTLYAGQSHQLFHSSSDVDVRSSSDFIVSVSKRGLVVADHVGSAEIAVGGAKCEVTVEPYYTIYPDPYINWGAPKATVKANNAGTPYYESDTELFYQLSDTAIMGYLFENNRLNGVGVTVIATSASQLSSFLSERYEMVYSDPSAGYGNVMATYVDAYDPKDVTTAIGMFRESLNSWIVMYIPYPTGASRSVSLDFKERLDAYRNLVSN